MNILKVLVSSFLWAIGGIAILFIYAYSEQIYLILICIAIILLTIYYRKSIIALYAEVFEELGITKYLKQIKDFKKYKRPIHKVMSSLGLW